MKKGKEGEREGGREGEREEEREGGREGEREGEREEEREGGREGGREGEREGRGRGEGRERGRRKGRDKEGREGEVTQTFRVPSPGGGKRRNLEKILPIYNWFIQRACSSQPQLCEITQLLSEPGSLHFSLGGRWRVSAAH